MTGPYRFHILGLPWTNTTDEFSWCAYTQKVAKFGRMMTRRGHEVFIYSGPENTADCTEHVEVITAEEQAPMLGTQDAPWEDLGAWAPMNQRAIAAIRKRAEPTDFLLMTCGPRQQPVARALPWLKAVEYGIGYHETSADFRVFESYAWMHTIYTREQGSNWDGRNYDAVIPNYFDSDDFGPARPPDVPPYFLFIGRGIRRKGPQIAADVAEYLGVQLVIAGAEIEPGGFPAYGERAGLVGPATRREMMAGAAAVFAPTLYGGPFEGVAVEAMMSGAPVITSDWGAFAETVQDGDGWRCHTMAEYVDAGRAALNGIRHDRAGVRRARRERAINRYGLNAVGAQYERFFGRLFELQGPGWGHMEHWRPPEA